MGIYHTMDVLIMAMEMHRLTAQPRSPLFVSACVLNTPKIKTKNEVSSGFLS